MAQQSDAELMLAQLLCAHEAFYDVQSPYTFAGHTFPGYAEFHTHGEKYVLSKKAKIWEVDAHEYMFFVVEKRLEEERLDELSSFMVREALTKVNPVPDHMTSYLTLVVVADEVAAEATAKVRRIRFRKNFRLGLRGWADLRLAVVDMALGKVYTNGQGKEIKGSLEANLRKMDGAMQAPKGMKE